MIKSLYFSIFFILIFKLTLARNIGETEITTEDGIEVFQEEKYYLLKKNVEIISDELELNGQIVKIFFEKDLYDIIELIAHENVDFISNEYNISGKGNEVIFKVPNQEIYISGEDSELYLENSKMFSDGKIKVNNLEGNFFINGPNSRLISDNIDIIGSEINGNFEIINDKREIGNLIVIDEKKLKIVTDDITMYSKKAIYNKKTSLIELFDEVQINRGNEIITGDYGTLDTNKSAYKVSSNNSAKVKAIIMGSDE